MHSLIAALIAATLSVPALAATADDIRRAEEAFARAVAAGSAAELQRLLADDFLYQHTTGKTYTRADIVRLFGNREITVTSWGPLDMQLRDYGDTVITHGSRRIAGMLGATAYAGSLRFVDVWRRQPDGSWRLVHRNSELLEPQ